LSLDAIGAPLYCCHHLHLCHRLFCAVEAATQSPTARNQNSEVASACDPAHPITLYPVTSEFKTLLLFNATVEMQRQIKLDHFSKIKRLALANASRSAPACGSRELQKLIQENNVAVGDFLNDHSTQGLRRLDRVAVLYASTVIQNGLIHAAIKYKHGSYVV